jgi:DNA polymerase (family 10)
MPSDGQNQDIAERIKEAAILLESQGADVFRVGAYRRAADAVAHLDRPVSDILADQGIEGLDAIPGIGPSLAGALAEMVRTGRWARLDRLRGSADPDILFRTVPGIGPGLAAKIHDLLHVDSLEALEIAAHDGRLAALPGVGSRRAAAIAASLGVMLARRRPLHGAAAAAEPDIATLLEIDAEYRRKAEADELPKIAPRRFNPSGEAWLPILHAERGPWHFTVLFSNTARSHELGRTKDWAIVYFNKDDTSEGQRTIVTETRGALLGRRVVRGRENECRAFYAELVGG